MRAAYALQKLLLEYRFTTVLDIGCGDGGHSEAFRAAGKEVTSIDLAGRYTAAEHADYMERHYRSPYDAIWCCHVLEHQLNAHSFLLKVFNELKEGGVLCLSVPPMKPQVVGGHVTIWNAGLLMYNLILAGFNCSSIRVKREGYNISAIIEKVAIRNFPELAYDRGDIKRLSEYFPPTCRREGFNGNIEELAWDV